MPTTPAQDEFLAMTRKSQEAVIAAIKTWVETVKTASPRLAPLTDKLPKMPSFSVPLADRLPGREETVANAYRLAEQVLANQRKFAEDLLKLMTPLIPGRVESTPGSDAPESAPASPAAKSTAARTAPKSTAAKSTSASTAAKSAAARPTPKGTAAKSTAARPRRARPPRAPQPAGRRRAPPPASAGTSRPRSIRTG